jgi:hypothetical protein
MLDQMCFCFNPIGKIRSHNYRLRQNKNPYLKKNAVASELKLNIMFPKYSYDRSTNIDY